MRNPILMFRTALIATIGFFAVCSISHADKAPPPPPKCNNDACQQYQQILEQLGSQNRSAAKPDAGRKGVPAGTTSHGAAGRK